jgi:ATP-dependent RNA helicase DDX5/DBP2
MSGQFSSNWSNFDKNSSLGSSLPTINWANINLTTVRKNFYNEHPAVSNRSETEVKRIREEFGITVFGNTPKPIVSFNEANFPNSILQVLNEVNFLKPTPIQCQGNLYSGWPLALSGKDFVGIAQTGSGKTLAFMLPALVHIADQEPLRVNFM